MPTRIKNCGLKTTDAIDCAITTGAGFVGFVHHEPSPRHVTLEQMETLRAHAGSLIKTVAVLVNPSDDLLSQIAHEVKPDYFQLHDARDTSRIQAIHAQFGIPIISAISVKSEADLTNIATLEEISSHLLFDAPSSGSGKAFDWRLLKNLPLKKRWFLAGGLNAGNVAEAMRITGAPMVDVSSGIESSAGEKSQELIAAFNAAVLQTHHSADNRKWDSFYARTMHLPSAELTANFLSYLSPNAHVLDFGAGSGSWTAAFLRDRPDLLIDVLDKNIDDARALPSDFRGKRIKQTFQDFRAVELYDAIWAQSVLFFLPPNELAPCFHELIEALKSAGTIAFTMVETCENASLAKFYGMSESAIREILDKEGLEVVSIMRAEYPYGKQRVMIPTFDVFARKR